MKKQCLLILAILLVSTNGFSQFKIYHPYWYRISVEPSVPVVKKIELETGVQLEYAEQGDPSQPAVVMMHGFTDSWKSYRSVLESLPPSVHAIAITMRGHGDSDHPVAGYEPALFSEDIAALIQQLDLKPVLLVGHSFGGLVAQRVAIDHPGLLRGLILLGTTANFTVPEMKEFAGIVNSLQALPPDFAKEFQQSTLIRPIDTAWFQELVAESMKMPLSTWKAILSGMVKADLREELGQIKTTVRIIWGEQDAYCVKGAQQEMLRLIPDATLATLPNSGHAVHWEEPGLVADEIVQFLSQLTHP